jgi:acetyl esterase/lipase
MAQRITAIMAGLLFLVESEASDVAHRSALQGFLSKYTPAGADAPRSSMSDYDKFITPNLNRVKHEKGAEALASHNDLAEPGLGMGVRPFTIVNDKPVPHPTAQVEDSMAFTTAREEPSISTEDFNPPTIADREEKQAVQKLVTNDSSNPMTLSAIGIGLLSLAMMLGVRLRRGLQPASILASSGGLGPVRPINTASDLGDYVMEMKSQDPNINFSAAMLETRPMHKVNSSRVGWGQLSSQNSQPLMPRTTTLLQATPSLGLYGDWEPSTGGSYILEAADGPENAKGIVHFLGGAFVGAGSQLTYRYLLECFAKANYAVIATPFRLSFDYQSVCDVIEVSYDEARLEFQERGYSSDLEIVGVGHSCGALLHSLISTRRPDERRRLALLSYNNKPAADAIPMFQSVVAPIAVEAVAESLPTTPVARQALSLLRNASEELLDAATDTDSNNPLMRLRAAAPDNLRALGDAFIGETSTIARQGLEIADQLPDLLEEIAGGAREFEPEPREMRDLLRFSFRADDVLVVQFDNDEIDESDELYSVLRDSAARRKAEGEVEVADPAVRLVRLAGTHLTPLTQDIFLPAEKVSEYASAAENVSPVIEAPRRSFLRDIDATWGELEGWLAR